MSLGTQCQINHRVISHRYHLGIEYLHKFGSPRLTGLCVSVSILPMGALPIKTAVLSGTQSSWVRFGQLRLIRVIDSPCASMHHYKRQYYVSANFVIVTDANKLTCHNNWFNFEIRSLQSQITKKRYFPINQFTYFHFISFNIQQKKFILFAKFWAASY